jgi:hypothetical protein
MPANDRSPPPYSGGPKAAIAASSVGDAIKPTTITTSTTIHAYQPKSTYQWHSIELSDLETSNRASTAQASRNISTTTTTRDVEAGRREADDEKAPTCGEACGGLLALVVLLVIAALCIMWVVEVARAKS